MNTIQRLLAAASIGLVFHASAVAAPANPAAVEQLLILSKSEQILDVAYSNFEQSMRQGMLNSIGDKPLTARQQQVVQNLPRRVG